MVSNCPGEMEWYIFNLFFSESINTVAKAKHLFFNLSFDKAGLEKLGFLVHEIACVPKSKFIQQVYLTVTK